MGVVLHAAGWVVESEWLDFDGTGARTWNRAVDPDGAEMWCTTSQLQERLHRAGLDIGDLAFADPADDPDRSPARNAQVRRPSRRSADRSARRERRRSLPVECDPVDVDDECE